MSNRIGVASLNIQTGLFSNNTNIVNVNCNYSPFTNNSIAGTFENCTNLQTVSHINNNVTNMYNAFSGCSNLISVDAIPSNVTNMAGAFANCTSITNIPAIPNSVTDVSEAFRAPYSSSGSSIVVAPNIPGNNVNCVDTFCHRHMLTTVQTLPNNITNAETMFFHCYNLVNIPSINVSNSLHATFQYCTNLTTAPNMTFIGDNIDAGQAFIQCYNLTGNIVFNTPNITTASAMFYGTTLQKNVYIPFNINGVNTKTYNSFISAGYTNDGSFCGVYLKDLNDQPTPGGSIDVEGYTYTQDAQGVVTLTDAPIDAQGSVKFPNIQE